MQDLPPEVRHALIARLRNVDVSSSLAARDRAIRAAHRGGMSLRELATVVGVSHETVRRVVKEPDNE